MSDLLRSIKDKSATIGIVGLGYVGLPLAVTAGKGGYKVIGFDVTQAKVEMVNKGINYIGDIENETFSDLVKKGLLKATSDFKQFALCDVIVICVPTPLDIHLQPDVSFIVDSTKEIAKYMKKPALVILESTTFPGTTEEIVLPILESNGSKLGRDVFVAFSPERVDPGNDKFKTDNTPKVVGGCTDMCNELAKEFYNNILSGGIHNVSSPKVAEMEKLLENTFRLVNIGLVNEIALLSDRMGIDIWEVIDAAKTKPYGFMPFYPGPGLGGHCIPIDPYYLTWKAKEYNFQATVIEACGTVNHKMPEFVVEKTAKLLNEQGKCFSNAKILMLGVAYKKDIDDYRESPALTIIELLENENTNLKIVDPFVKEFKGHSGKTYKPETELTDKLLKDADLVILITDHTSFNKEQIVKNSKVVYDTRNFLKIKAPNVVTL